MFTTLIPTLERAGFRQADVARLLSLSPATVSRMYDGQRELTVPEGFLLRDALREKLDNDDVTLDSLFPSEPAGRAA